jgi:predicted dehydrogenase
MGRRHIQMIKALGLDFVGVSDVLRASLEAAMHECGVGENLLYDGAADLLRQSRPDAVVIATTATSHAHYTKLAVEAGASAILCEKPMAVSLEQCDEMIELCRRKGVRLAINHQMRFMDQYRKPMELLQSEDFGGVTAVTVIGPNFGLAMNGLHFFEAFRFITDENVESVTAWLSADTLSNPRGPQFEDKGGSVRLVTPSGRRFYLDAGVDQGIGIQVVYSARFGQIVVDEYAMKLRYLVRHPEGRKEPTSRYGTAWTEHETLLGSADIVALSGEMMNALLKGGDYCTGEQGRNAVSALVSAHLSHERGNIAINPSRDELPVNREFPWA